MSDWLDLAINLFCELLNDCIYLPHLLQLQLSSLLLTLLLLRWTSMPVTSMPQKFPMTLDPTVSCQNATEILKREGFDQMPVVGPQG